MPEKRVPIKRALRDSIADGTSSSVMSAITGTYTVPFALSLGANTGEIGLLNSIPKLAGTLSQMFERKFIVRMRGRKPACNRATLLSRLLWIPIALIPFFFTTNPIFWLIALLTLSQLASSLAVTAWASWVGDLVPTNMMGRFFGRRNAIGGIASFLTTLIAGFILTTVNGSFGFTTIFLIAVVAGLVSSFFLRRIPEPAFHDGHHMRSTIKEFGSELRHNSNFKHFVSYMTAFNLAVNIASPFFAVWMIQNLALSYDTYAVIIALNIFATVFSQPYWGRLADRFGDRAVMAVCSIFATAVPGLALFAHGPLTAAAVMVFSGFAWAGMDLATFNYILGSTSHKPSYIANYSMITGLAVVAGPLIGGILAESNVVMLGFAGISAVFLLSFVLRGLFSAVLIPRLKEVRPSGWTPPIAVLLWRSVSVYPFRYFMHELALAQHYIYHHRPRRGILSPILRR